MPLPELKLRELPIDELRLLRRRLNAEQRRRSQTHAELGQLPAGARGYLAAFDQLVRARRGDAIVRASRIMQALAPARTRSQKRHQPLEEILPNLEPYRRLSGQ